MSELLAIQSLRVYTATPKAGSLGLPAPVTGFNITETPLNRLEASQKKCIGGVVSFIPLFCTAPGGFVLSAGVGSISATSTKVLSDSLKPLREGDEGTCTGSQANPSGATLVCNCTMKIQTAGQMKVKCE